MILSTLGGLAADVIGPARRLAHHAGWDEAEAFLHPIAVRKRQLSVRDYSEQLQQALASEGAGATEEEPDAATDPADGTETTAAGGPEAAPDDGDGSVLDGIGRAVHRVGEWLSDAW